MGAEYRPHVSRLASPLLAACLAFAGCGGPDTTVPPPAGPAGSETTGAAPQRTTLGVELDDARPAELRAVLDGDSLEVTIGGKAAEIRMLGINTPEQAECWSAEAGDATARLVEGTSLEIADRGRDRFGRLLGYVLADGEMVNLSLLLEGHGLAIATEHAFRDEFLAAEESAYRAGRGMWGAGACGPPAGERLRIEQIEPDPPGPDDDPQTGEYLRIRNEGSSPVDLTGWTVRDESSTHRYTFPAGTEVAPGATVSVRSVCGVAEHCFGTATVWSNGGDTALLLDANGNVVDRVRYPGV